MDVLIKNMEMPTNCENCRFFAWSYGVGQHCAVAPSITFYPTIDGMDVNYERNNDCPLFPVPPHGDLIDRSILKTDADFDLYLDDFINYSEEQIRLVPVVIPANCVSYVPKDYPKPCTHYDRIVSKSREELADYLAELSVAPNCTGKCHNDFEVYGKLQTFCHDCWLNWLKQEVDNG